MKREIRVIGDTETQPLWVKIFKILLMVGLSFTVYSFYGLAGMSVFLCSLISCGTVSHFIHRWKTGGWTRSWGFWTHEDDASKASRRVPTTYYMVVLLSLLLSLAATVIIVNTFFT
ncbi:hypothetical protein JXL21_11060 [Candidatus Bathyarchaeota archaeon]|nr:hypothetical protein [Candidatus Bathyarchaeota archaeon]